MQRRADTRVRAFGDTTVDLSDGPASLRLDLLRGKRRAVLHHGAG
ncbi:MAG TPA: hypothetical protein VGJ86_02585 [Acidimicrobiales bacterium]